MLYPPLTLPVSGIVIATGQKNGMRPTALLGGPIGLPLRSRHPGVRPGWRIRDDATVAG